MKKIMPLAASILLILVAGVFASAGTIAYFVDPETIAPNTFQAAYLDLELSPEASLPFSVGNLVPGDSGSDHKTLTNVAGSIDGELDVTFTNLVESENGIIEPEAEAGDYENGGDLWIALRMAVYLDVNQDGSFGPGDIQLAYNNQILPYETINYLAYANPRLFINTYDDIMTMTGGQSVDLIILWQLPPNWADLYPNYNYNIVMTDTLAFDIVASLEQVGTP